MCTFGMNDTCPAGMSGAKMCNMKGSASRDTGAHPVRSFRRIGLI
jgi:hypothetical protein